jgi:leucyl aminopeptidase
MAKEESLIQLETVERLILLIRGEKVILDADLARLYGVTTRALNQAVKRNIKRFPEDFMFQLSAEEVEAMRSQIVTASKRNVRFLPYVFTEHGAIMAANILNSEKAVSASVQVVRAFVKLRQMLTSNAELAKKLEALEKKYDAQFKVVFEAIRQLMLPPDKAQRKIGFIDKDKKQ